MARFIFKTNGTNILNKRTRGDITSIAVGGRPFGISSRTTINIRALTELSMANGTMAISNRFSNSELSLGILSMAGCVLMTDSVHVDQNFSLLNQQTDTELVDNPNKMDVVFFTNLKSQTIIINDVFRNTEDSIFALDANLSFNQQRTNARSRALVASTPVCTDIVDKLINLNFAVKGVPTLRALGGSL